MSKTDRSSMKLNKESITDAARIRFAPDTFEVRCLSGWWGVFVGPQREHCYAVVLLQNGKIDFEQCD